MTGQLALFPDSRIVSHEQLALDLPEMQHSMVKITTECKKQAPTSTERPTMPTPTEAPDYPTRLPRWLTAWNNRRRGRARTRAAQKRRANDRPVADRFANLTANDLITIRYALEDRERIHQGTPAGEAAHITRTKLG